MLTSTASIIFGFVAFGGGHKKTSCVLSDATGATSGGQGGGGLLVTGESVSDLMLGGVQR